MSYPNSPFPDSLNSKLVTNLLGDKYDKTISNEEFKKICKWLCSFPKITTCRVNTLKCNVGDAINIIQNYFHNTSGRDYVKINIHPLLTNVILIHHSGENIHLKTYEKEIIIDVDCAAAVLRGAHIYAPGVIGMMSGCQIGEKVSIYADTVKKCRRGLLKRFEDEEKLYIGNGVVKMQRHQLFAENIIIRWKSPCNVDQSSYYIDVGLSLIDILKIVAAKKSLPIISFQDTSTGKVDISQLQHSVYGKLVMGSRLAIDIFDQEIEYYKI